MARIASYRQGRILYAYLRSSATGKMERHPAIILNADQDITQPENFDPRTSQRDNVIYAVGVSTKYKSFNVDYVRLPFTTAGHAQTGLREDCAAIVGWYHRIFIPDDVIGCGGDVPAPVLL